MIYIVTGAAGFIGSHLTDRLLTDGYQVIGIDCFRDYYSPDLKRKNLTNAMLNKNFELFDLDLSSDDLSSIENKLPDDTEFTVIHLAAQAGVRKSWGEDFNVYIRDNIAATQHLLEWAKNKKNLNNFVYASSSSVYGNVKKLPMTEDDSVPNPFSPYGVTKLAGENLVRLYFKNYDLPSVSLRFFTVYGPRQRPDMAFNRFFRSALKGEKIRIFGNGSQTRDFTFIDDIIEGLVSASNYISGEIFNLGGGNRLKLIDTVDIIGRILGVSVEVEFLGRQPGDVTDTLASTDKAEKLLGWKPEISLYEGLSREAEWIQAT